MSLLDDNNRVKYSVIIPNYNSNNLLMRLLESIPVRDDVEVIVIDDCSSDTSFSFCVESAKFNHVKFLEAKEKSYAGGARNIGIKNAHGEYLTFADADDYFTSDAFDIFDSASETNSDLILFETTSFIEESNEIGSRHIYRNKRLGYGGKLAALGAVGPCAKLVKKHLIDSNEIYFSEVIVANDVVFSTKVACLAESIDIVKSTVYCISQNDSSLTAQSSLERSQERLREQRKRIMLVKKYKPVKVLSYCFNYSLLNRFYNEAKNYNSQEFNDELQQYKLVLGKTICGLKAISRRVPFSGKIIKRLLNIPKLFR